MAERRPLVTIAGQVQELPAGDSLPGSGGGSPIAVQDEGSNITTALATLNFTGSGVTVTGGATSVVNIPGGGGTYNPALGWAF